MSNNKYFYIGIGVITLVLFIGFVTIFNNSLNSQNQESEIIIKFSDSSISETFVSKTNKDLLFSEKVQVLKFSQISEDNQISQKHFECEIICKK